LFVCFELGPTGVEPFVSEKRNFQESSQGLDCGGVLKLMIGLTDVVSYLTVRVKFVVCANAPEVPVTVMV
jgi:hypothetical protein